MVSDTERLAEQRVETPPVPPDAGGPSPWVVLGIAFVVGFVIAKVLRVRSR